MTICSYLSRLIFGTYANICLDTFNEVEFILSHISFVPFTLQLLSSQMVFIVDDNNRIST